MFNLKNDDEFEKAIQLANEYRSEFFKRPMGIFAFRDVTPSDGMAMNLDNLNIAESYHYEFCIECKSHKQHDQFVKLFLINKNGGYCFICNDCKNLK